MRSFIKYSFVLLLIFASSAILADVDGINVTLKPVKKGVTYRAKVFKNGNFSIKNIEPNEYQLILDYKGKKEIIGEGRGNDIILRKRPGRIKFTKELDKATPLLARMNQDMANHNTTRSNRLAPKSIDTDHNSSRSNKTSIRAQDYNSSRSNTTSAANMQGDDDSDGDSVDEIRSLKVDVEITNTKEKYEFRGHVTVLK